MTDDADRDRRKLSLRPLDFEEALADLLATEPPPKGADEGEREREQERPRKTRRSRKAGQAQRDEVDRSPEP